MYVRVPNHQGCRMLNNFASMWAIISGLNGAAVYRLRRTWDMRSQPAKTMYERMETLMDSTRNHAEYREQLAKVNPPCVPFCGLYTKDLTFLEDGNPDFLASAPRLINYAKRQKVAEVITQMKLFQNTAYVRSTHPSYPFVRVPPIQKYIRDHFRGRMEEHQRYERSLALEPRASAEDHVSKLLQESGFL